jgi:hypothetical protein
VGGHWQICLFMNKRKGKKETLNDKKKGGGGMHCVPVHEEGKIRIRRTSGDYGHVPVQGTRA